MIYDHRTYVCRPGTIQKHLTLYGNYGYPAQRRILGAPVIFAQVETGDVNSFVHVWTYDDAADRAAKRARLMADPDWQDYLRRSAEAGYLVSQTNKILTPAPFFEG
ncbi:NIPSNAP family protein [Pseudosulfitobacter pseudonitzschiae]|uniref:NIPSNAP family protein n=1 Tax=Pseudosulfitobacter pseudonitzschiae TaxID=1402135 RepID=UPI001AFAF01B|nr:NIPSNAP family protein [Pseudosulfitobacter pseudonitzschiae]MBM1817780.1 NIPSNAP family protein [Pseudosulfitobacter pseudonitzschiae]MBM1834775.1 NIPSNAP family protein [Pseudosulfitobacter pseudonitzschiae]MBM1839639.1 NIPSNAP family protein [Pseudosulfitobacter pseudonitzschiae]MBM1844490.1 NIPSNAP family protein [Pseudosulfitobacter pseudonitzschiae]MBM1849324.1 NIPSNAP family protein [Pseudosulfitobacter pseudonitzschiae]